MSNTKDTFKIQEILRKNSINYNIWLASHFIKYAGRNIIDIGSGYGNVIKNFIKNGRKITCLDIESEYIDYLNSNFGGFGLKAVKANFETFDVASLAGTFDNVSCFNVLEHLEDDHGALKKMYELLCPGGSVFLMVPAGKWLYGTMDASDAHFRRYSKKELRDKLEKSGFIIHKLNYMNFFGMFGWFLNGRILKTKIISSKQAGFFDKLVPMLKRLEDAVTPPLGQSLIVIAEKRL